MKRVKIKIWFGVLVICILMLSGTTQADKAKKRPVAASGTTASNIAVSSFMETVLDDPDATNARRTLQVVDYINVKEYGAVGDDTADDTTAIQNALDDLPTNGGVVFFPEGTYKVSAKLNVPAKTTLLGVQTGASLIKFSSGTATAILDCTQTSISSYINIRDLNILGSGRDVFLGAGILFRGVLLGEIKNCEISGVATGIKFDGTDLGGQGNAVLNCRIVQCQIGSGSNTIASVSTGIHFAGDGSNGPSACTVRDSLIRNTDVEAIYIEGAGSSSNFVERCDLTGNMADGIVIEGSHNKIVSNHFENASLTGYAIDIAASTAVYNQIGPGNNYVIAGKDLIRDLGRGTYFLDYSHQSSASSPGFASSEGTANLLRNAELEQWEGNTAPNWSVTLATLTKETTTVKRGTASAKLVYAGATDNAFYQNISPWSDYYRGRAITFSAWVWSDTAGVAKLQIIANGTWASVEHTGGSSWEHLVVTTDDVGAAATFVRCQLTITAASTNYIDGASVYEGLVARPSSPHPSDGDFFAAATWDPGSIANGAKEALDVTVTGAALGDFAIASFSLDVLGLILDAQVTAADTVTCILANNTGGAINLSEGTLRVKVIKK